MFAHLMWQHYWFPFQESLHRRGAAQRCTASLLSAVSVYLFILIFCSSIIVAPRCFAGWRGDNTRDNSEYCTNVEHLANCDGHPNATRSSSLRQCSTLFCAGAKNEKSERITWNLNLAVVACKSASHSDLIVCLIRWTQQFFNFDAHFWFSFFPFFRCLLSFRSGTSQMLTHRNIIT